MADKIIQLNDSSNNLLFPRTYWRAILDAPAVASPESVAAKQDKLTSLNAGAGISITTDGQGNVIITALNTNDYTALINKPSINNVTITGALSLAQLGIVSVDNTNNGAFEIADPDGRVIFRITDAGHIVTRAFNSANIPVYLSQLVNDYGYTTAIDIQRILQDYLTAADLSTYIVAGSNITITNNNNILTISSTGGSGGSSNYNDLLNKPQINGTTLQGNVTLNGANLMYDATNTLNDQIDAIAGNIAITNNSIATSGDGNAITSLAISSGQLVAYRDTSFASQSALNTLSVTVAGKADTSWVASNYAPINSPTFTGTVTLPTSTKIGSLTTTGIVTYSNGTLGVSTADYLINPMNNVGDMIYGGADGVPLALSAGNPGQILIFSDDYTPAWSDWNTAGFLKTNSLGEVSVDTSSYMTSPMTTKGDIIYASDNNGTPARLARGNMGSLLVMDGSGTSVPGDDIPKWVAHPGVAGKVLTSAVGSNGTTVYWATPTTGMSNPMTTQGDIIIGGIDGAPTRLGKPNATKFLQNTSTGTLTWGDIYDHNINSSTAISGDVLMADGSGGSSWQTPFTGYTSSNKLSTDYINNVAGWTSNAGTVTSVQVQAGTGLTSSQSTAQTTTLNTTIGIDNGYKLPTTTEWGKVVLTDTDQSIDGTKTFVERPLYPNTVTLPSGYTQLEYIHSDGTAYINTGRKYSTNDSVELIFQQDDTANYRIWGTFNQSSYSGKNVSMTYSVGWCVRQETRDGQAAMVTFGAIDTKKHTLKILPSGHCYFDGVDYGKSEGWAANFTFSYNAYLFTINPGGTAPTATMKGRVYRYRVWRSGALVQDMYPVKYVSGGTTTYGMYDVINNQYYTNANSSGTLTGAGTPTPTPMVFEDDLSQVAFSGDYNDLNNLPTIPTNYVTTNTAQTVSATKTFTAQQKFQSGSPSGCVVFGANVSATTVSAGTRKLARLTVPTYETNGSSVVGFVSIDNNAYSGGGGNAVEFGSRNGDSTSFGPDLIAFSVATSHNVSTRNNIAQFLPSKVQLFNHASGQTSIQQTPATNLIGMWEFNNNNTFKNNTYTYTLPNTTGTIALTSDIPSVPVTDVQINSTSILSSGVANILTNTAYNSSTNKIATMSDVPNVPSWALASTKPSYSLSEISGTDDLQAIEGLTGTSGLLKKTAANTWSLDTNSYLVNPITALGDLIYGNADGSAGTRLAIGTSGQVLTSDGNAPVWGSVTTSGISSGSATSGYVLTADGSGGVSWAAGGGSGTVTSVGITNGGGLSVSGSPITSSGSITLSHADTSSQASVSNSGRTYIQSVTLDDYGHVTALSSATETVTDTNTTYTLNVSGTGENANKVGLVAGGSGSGTTWYTIPFATNAGTASSANSVTWANVSGHADGVKADIGIASSGSTYLKKDGTWDTPTDTNTTYALSGALSSHKFTSTLTAGGSGSGTSTSDFTLAAGSNITLTDDTSNRKITIAATDTNTTYSLTVSGTGDNANKLGLTAGGSGSGTTWVTIPYATSAESAEKDSDGNVIKDTYLKSVSTVKNDLTLLKEGSSPGDSYALIFQRGTLTDSYNDWRIQDRGGFLYFDQRGSGSTSWSNQAYINTSGTLYATTFSGSGASLTSLNASNISSGTINVARLPSITSAKVSDFTTAARGAISGTSPISYSSSTGAISIESTGASSGQVLTADGSGGVSWATPASGGMANPMTTKGDIIVGGDSGAPTRLAGSSTTKFLRSTGSSVGISVAWDDIQGTYIKSGTSNNYASAGQVLTADGSGSASWQSITHPSDIFEATYGTTSYYEILNAAAAGKICIVKYNDLIYELSHNPLASGVMFTCVNNGVEYRVWVDDTDTWGNDSANIGTVKKVNNVSPDANGNVTIQGTDIKSGTSGAYSAAGYVLTANGSGAASWTDPSTVYNVISGITDTAGSSTSGSVLSVKWSVANVAGITTPYDGMKILVRIPRTGVSTGGVLLSIDNGTTYHPVAYNVNTVLTSHYPVNSNKIFVYNATQTMTGYQTAGTATTYTGVWQAESDYNSDTLITRGTKAYRFRPYASATVYKYKIVAFDANRKLVPIVTNNNTTNPIAAVTSLTPTTASFRPDKFFYYNSTTTVSSGSRVADDTLISIGYNDTNVALCNFNSGLTASRLIYLVGLYNTTTGLFKLRTGNNYVLQANLNGSAAFSSGYDYIVLGATGGSNNQFYLREDHPMFHYDGTNLLPYDTWRLNNYTVEGENILSNDQTITPVSTGKVLTANGTGGASWETVSVSASSISGTVPLSKGGTGIDAGSTATWYTSTTLHPHFEVVISNLIPMCYYYGPTTGISDVSTALSSEYVQYALKQLVPVYVSGALAFNGVIMPNTLSGHPEKLQIIFPDIVDFMGDLVNGIGGTLYWDGTDLGLTSITIHNPGALTYSSNIISTGIGGSQIGEPGVPIYWTGSAFAAAGGRMLQYNSTSSRFDSTLTMSNTYSGNNLTGDIITLGTVPAYGIYTFPTDYIYLKYPYGGSEPLVGLINVTKINNYIYQLTGSGSCSVTNKYVCLTGDTLVTMADGSTKRLDMIELGEEILSFDWNTMKLIPNKVVYTDKDEHKAWIEYDIWTFDDGTKIKTVHRHEFYNVEAKRFKYMDEWVLGEHTYKIDGTTPKLINHERVREGVAHYKISGEHGTNYFANGLLTGDRYCPKSINLG